MHLATIQEFWKLFKNDLSIITICGLILLFVFILFPLQYLIGFIVDISNSSYTHGTIESIETTYHTDSRKSDIYGFIPDYNAIITFFDSDYNYHTFKSFSLGKQPIGERFGVFYWRSDYDGLKSYSSTDVFLLLIFYIFLVIVSAPIYLLIIEYYSKKINKHRQNSKIKSIFSKGMILWFIGIIVFGFGGGTLWMYFEGHTIISGAGIILLFFVLRNFRNSLKKI